MFGSTSTNPFGQSSMANPFAQTPCGIKGINPCAQKQSGIGGHNPFGSFPSGNSLSWGTSTGGFGQPSAVTPSPAFGTSSSAGGSTQFGQNAGFGGFGPNPDGSVWQRTQPTFGSNSFGTTKTVGPFCGLSKPPFGASTSAFSTSTAPTFGGATNPSSSATNPPAFGSSTPAFGSTGATQGVSSSGTISSGNGDVFGKPSTPGFGVTGTPSFGSSTPFGAQANAFTLSQGFQQKPFGSQQGGTRVAKHTPTTAEDSVQSNKIILQSISAMPVYEHRSHEELRWDDHQHGDKGGPSFAGHTNPNAFPSAARTFFTSGTSASAVSVPTSSSIFSPFSPTSIRPSPSSFNSIASTARGIALLPTSSTFSFNSPSSSPSMAVSSTQPSFVGLEKTSSFTPNASGTTTGIELNNPASSMLPLDNPRDFSQTIVTPSFLPTFRPATPVQTPYYYPTQPAPSTCSCGTSSVFGHETFRQVPFNQSTTVMQPLASVNPFGTLPTAPGPTSVQSGISSMPVSEKPTSNRTSTLSTPRHLSHSRISLPLRKYNDKPDSLKVAFFEDEGLQPSSEADLFTPRKNPRSLIIVWPTEQWPSRDSTEKQSILKDTHNFSNENATSAGNDCPKEQHNRSLSPPKSATWKLNIEAPMQKLKISGNGSGDADIASKHSADIESMMPKLHNCDYYTEPIIQEIAAKERAMPGFCSHVKDFVVGRHGYGCIKFYGETDVRGLDLDSIIQFNNREVVVYTDGSSKPPVGQGLNKPAEITLLNIKCIDKKTGVHYTNGLMAEKYEEMLVKKAKEHGAEFVSFDAVKGLWKFKVRCF